MKVLHVCFGNEGGGAARAAYRLHRGQLAMGISSQFLVWEKTGDDVSVIQFPDKKRKLYQIFTTLIAQRAVTIS